MQVSAKLRYARISPQKCRLVADLVRGRPVGSALGLLRACPDLSEAESKLPTPAFLMNRADGRNACGILPRRNSRSTD